MAREDVRILDTGDQFPEMDFDVVGGGKIKIPEDCNQKWSVFLIYRGSW